jgi:hypothetical protein
MFVQDVSYNLKLTLHARVMLCFRYGIHIHSVNDDFIFKRIKEHPESGKEIDIFHHGNRSVTLVIDLNSQTVITAYPPKNGVFTTHDSTAVGAMLDIACVTLQMMPIENIMDWRQEYIDGEINKDDIKKYISKSKNNFYQESTLIDLKNMITKLYEVIEIKDSEISELEANILRAEKLTWIDHDALTENAVISNYSLKLKNEIATSNLDANIDCQVNYSLNEGLPEATFEYMYSQASIGFPWSDIQIGNYKNHPVYKVTNCIIHDLVEPSSTDESFYQILFEHNENFYIATTRHEHFFKFYSKESTTIYKLLFGGGNQYLHTPDDCIML